MASSLLSFQYSTPAANIITRHLRTNNFSKVPLGKCNVYHADPNSSLDEILKPKNHMFGFSLNVDQQSNPSIPSTTYLGRRGKRILRPNLHNTHTKCIFTSHDGNTSKQLDVDINNVGAINSISSTRAVAVLEGDPQVGEDTCNTALPFAGLDLSGKNFSGSCPKGADFSGANLTNVDFTGTDITNVNFTSVKSFAGVNFTNALSFSSIKNVNTKDSPFIDMSLKGVNLTGVVLDEINFTGTDFRYASPQEVWHFTSCTLVNANFSGISTKNFVVDGLGDFSANGLNLSSSNIDSLKIAGPLGVSGGAINLNFKNLTLSEYIAPGIRSKIGFLYMKNSNFSGAQLTGVIFGDLEGEGWIGERVGLPDLTNANFSGANLTNATLGSSDFKTGMATNLTNADFSGANLTGVKFISANLTGANLTNANLTGADLTNANLTNANLTNANLAYAGFPGVIWKNTTCPDGTKSDELLSRSCPHGSGAATLHS